MDLVRIGEARSLRKVRALDEEVDEVRRTALLITAGLMLAVVAGAASAAMPDGERGPRARTLVYYVQRDLTDDELPIVVSHDPPYTNVLEVSLPDIDGKQAFVGTATFTLVNLGSVDADVHCAVGNQMGHELFVPVNQLSAPSLGGFTQQNVATYTLTGIIDDGGTMALGCHLVDWVGSGQGTPAPDVRFRRGSLEVLFTSRLNDQTPTP